jgi:hypothetical protein
MEKNSKEEIKRFKSIFISTSLDKAKFAELFNLTPTMINNYLKGVADIQKVSRCLVKLGFSVDWLFSGKGSMHNSLVKIFDPALENKLDIDEMNKRINSWINKAFVSIEEFEQKSNVEYSLISDSIANSKLIPYKEIRKMKTIGLNYEWSVTGKGQMFSENRNGKKYKHRYITQLRGTYNV